MLWQVLSKNKDKDIIETLLKNRGINDKKSKDEFLNPTNPLKISLKSLGIKDSEVKKAIDRIKKAKKNKEKVIIYGDYDADGICSTAILWESLHEFGLDVLPHIPDRFSEGYGINAKSVENLKSKISNLKLIITVDNGIVATEGVKTANKLGIDVIVIDHHQKGKVDPPALSFIYSDRICGSALTWFFAREIHDSKFQIQNSLELAAIGTIADQMPLVGPNRSIVKWGLGELNKTKRPGLKSLFENSKIEEIGTYEINYIIAPRLNAMGRLSQGIESLRLLCTKRLDRAKELSGILDKTNIDRQKIVNEVVLHAMNTTKDKSVPNVIVLAHEDYHEGVIGLAAGKLVEEFYRPAIVLSKKGDIAKASARSISGFNIIEAIRSTEMIIEGGGHPMAAGFSIATGKIGEFTKRINELAKKLLTPEILVRKIKIDMEISFSDLTWKLAEELKNFDPTGLGNPAPTFLSNHINVVNIKAVGKLSKHLKIKLEQDGHFFDSIFFGGGEIYSKVKSGDKVDIVYMLEENIWNGNVSLQLKIKDLRLLN